MFKIKFILSICIFSILLGITSLVKTNTRIVEKKIDKLEKEISIISKDLHETELDFVYLSSPEELSKKIEKLGLVDYVPMNFSKIYFNYNNFINSQKKLTILKNNEEKTKKK